MAGSSEAQVILDGKTYKGFTKFTVDQSFEKASGQASLQITEQPGNPLPADVGSTCLIIVAGRSVINGYVDSVDADHDWTNHVINLSIRDKTQDLIDSTVGPDMTFKT